MLVEAGWVSKELSGGGRSRWSSTTEPMDASLVASAQEGDLWAQERLFRRYIGMVDRLAFRLAPNDAEADDIIQESFAVALDKLHKLREPKAFPGWLRTIVVRTARKQIRRYRLRVRLGLLSADPFDADALISGDASPDQRADLSALYRHILELPTEERLALVLNRVEGLTVPEIAELMGVSEPTVKRRLKRGRALLSRRCGREGGR